MVLPNYKLVYNPHQLYIYTHIGGLFLWELFIFTFFSFFLFFFSGPIYLICIYLIIYIYRYLSLYINDYYTYLPHQLYIYVYADIYLHPLRQVPPLLGALVRFRAVGARKWLFARLAIFGPFGSFSLRLALMA